MTMEYVKLGPTGLDVSRICLGCMTYGAPNRGNHSWTLDEGQSRPLIKQALDSGIKFLDTANIYSDGTSEEIAGRAIKDFSRREGYAGRANGLSCSAKRNIDVRFPISGRTSCEQAGKRITEEMTHVSRRS
jgi:predicted aldo/keto reductase-like oxidoreductase